MHISSLFYKHISSLFYKTGAIIGAVFLLIATLGTLFVYTPHAHAAVLDWKRGVSITPSSPTDFESSSFQQSLRNLKATGATYVDLVIPYYQTATGTDIEPGYNTPTDAALGSAIDYAHSIGLAVAINIHDNIYDGTWRAYINPYDRAGWFANYGTILDHLATIGQQHHAELFVIGTEMVNVASDINTSNTQYWINMIQHLRTIYAGALTYSADSDNNNNNYYQDEKRHIQFWPYLDYAGLSVYYDLNTSSNQPSDLEAQWDYWNKNDLQPFAQTVGKPLFFIEVGYRSIAGAHEVPWNWGMQGPANLTEQTNDYQALLDYWNQYNYLGGVFLWEWSSDPNAGGSNDNSYTPQNKPAQQVMTQWFTASPSTPASFSANANVSPSAPATGSNATITLSIKNTGGSLQNGIVDIEAYNSAGSRVFQQFYTGQNIAANSTTSYTASWTPNTDGTYRIKAGIFTQDWSNTLYWNDDATDTTVNSSSTTPPTSGVIDVWWPTNGAHVSGTQPFKAMLENTDISQYNMYWQVDGGSLVPMYNSTQDYPHKEAMVDLSQWTWRGSGPYTVTFIATNMSNSTIAQQSVQIWTQ